MAISEFPKNACAYEVYDPKTLKPANRQSSIRRAELGWTREDFAGKNVLDIGMNTGFLSLFAHQLGASRVKAVDVQQNLVDFFSGVVASHHLPIEVRRQSFKELQESDRSDVVLFMEVLHWTTSQGIPIRVVIQKLAALSGETLYIEFPWSVKEPSIREQTKLTEETYSADLVIEELGRHFEVVAIVRFMKYFGYGSPSRRVLIRAAGRRIEAPVLMLATDLDPLDESLGSGRNRVTLCNSPRGLKVVKAISKESMFYNIDQKLSKELFSELRGHPIGVGCVMPELVGDEYLISTDCGRLLMVLPLIEGEEPLKPGRKPVSFDLILQIAAALNSQFSRVSATVISSLRNAGSADRLLRGLQAKRHPPQKRLISDELWNAANTLLSENSGLTPDDLDTVVHGDLQTGNIVFDKEGNPRVIDLDNMCLGTKYLDGLCGIGWLGGDASQVRMLERLFTSAGVRKLELKDILIAISVLIGWLLASEGFDQATAENTRFQRSEVGIGTLLQFGRYFSSPVKKI